MKMINPSLYKLRKVKSIANLLFKRFSACVSTIQKASVVILVLFCFNPLKSFAIENIYS